MSTIRCDNFGPSSGGTSYSARGIAKAWVNFNGTGTIAARDSENVSSLTDNGTGDYSVSWSNNMNNNDYAIAQSYEVSVNSGARSQHQIDSYDYSVSGYRILTSNSSDQTASDFPFVWTTIFGDLA